MHQLHSTQQKIQKSKAVLVGIVRHGFSRMDIDESLEELALLADTAGAEDVGRVIQERGAPDPATFVGSGKVKEIAALASEHQADIVIFDDELSPAQMRNLEHKIEKRILDRSALILDIFALRAKTKEAQTQVELAQLEYLYPRLTRMWTHLERQEGAIGTRGPGETQLETDRRIIKTRISKLKKDLIKIENQRSLRRKSRDNVFKIALVGYTNAGKSSLMNSLTGSDVFVENRLFATLDATIRSFDIEENRKALLIDTVGFIRKLPHHLVASFRSTLEESIEADLLLHVVDVNHANFEEHIGTVQQVLRDLDSEQKPVILVFNKVDLLEDRNMLARLKDRYGAVSFISATQGIGLERLRQEIIRLFRESETESTVAIPVHATREIALVHELGRILEKTFEEDQIIIRFRARPEFASRIQTALEGLK